MRKIFLLPIILLALGTSTISSASPDWKTKAADAKAAAAAIAKEKASNSSGRGKAAAETLKNVAGHAALTANDAMLEQVKLRAETYIKS